MILIRLIMRFVLVPLGGCAAALVAAFVVCFAHWTEFAKIVANDPKAPENFILAVIFIGPAVALVMSIGAFAMLMPAMLGVAISEIFAFRSWVYHVTNGTLASAVGSKAVEQFLKQYEFFNSPAIIVSAGIAAGFAYWIVAGWSAGFWKPVFSQPPSTAPSVPTTTAPA